MPWRLLPAATATLDAFGTALQAREGDKFAAALDGLRAITKSERNDPVLWLVQLRLAQAIGESDIARDAIEQGPRAAHTAPARLQPLRPEERTVRKEWVRYCKSRVCAYF